MASAIQDSLFESFTEAAGGLTANLQGLVSSIGTATGSQPQTTTASASSTTGQSGGVGVLSTVATVLESGLGIVPLVAGLIGLFTGGNSSTPPPLVKYAMPEKMSFDYANTGSGISGADYDQFGMPRTFDGGQVAANAPAAPAGSSNGQTGVSAPQININVQAMDSKSFLDHSSEIAQAVRTAMLNLSSINDVVSEL